MIRGISFQIPQANTNTLYKILNGLNITEYDWQYIADQSEVWDVSSTKDFFLQTYYTGDSFLNLIQQNHYIIFLKLQAYLQPDQPENIHTYSDFIKSNCQLLLLIYDCEYVEIYAKSQTAIAAIQRSIQENGWQETCIITDYNDRRTKMDIC